MKIEKWQPPKAEVEKIRQKHVLIVKAIHGLLPWAIDIGEWLIAAKEKFPHGAWQPWVEENLPELGESTVRMYMQLAKYRPQLEEHFGLKLALPENSEEAKFSEAVVDKLPTLREARAWIAKVNRAKEMKKEKKAKKKGAKKAKKVVVEAPDVVTLVEQWLPTLDAFIEDTDEIDELERVVAWETVKSHVQAKLDEAEAAMPNEHEVP